MRLQSIEIHDSPPIRQFAVRDLSNVVVLAGPNGVGKTRLINSLLETFRNPHAFPQRRIIIEATSDSERSEWGKSTLDSSDRADVPHLVRTLQKQKSRSRWESSVIQFESDRSIQQIQPYTFSWDVIDPFLEMIGWDMSFGSLKGRFQDTIHSIFRKIQSRREDMATRAETRIKEGATSMDLDFPDPLIPFKLAFSQLLAPKELADPEVKRQRLFYRFEGQEFPLDSLSSGEREVVNIVFDFILRNPSHSIVIFDEPELHLHPELSYKLLQTLQAVGDQNQFIFCTHSPEIITASLENSVVFISPPRADGSNQAIPVREDDDTHQALRLLGQSIGIVALGRRIVLIEGADTSLDKQLYGTILKSRFPNLVLVPSGGKQVIQSFSTVVDAVLNKTIWGVEFFMLCDRDAVPLQLDTAAIESGAGGRLRVLPRYHLENYFLDERILAEVFRPMEPADSWLTDPHQIGAKLKDLARDMSSYTAALMEAASYRQAVGNVDVMPKGVHGKAADEIATLVADKAKAEVARVAQTLDATKVSASVRERMAQLHQSLDDGSDTWKRVIPGKQLLARFAGLAKMDLGRLKTLYVRQVELSHGNTFDEIIACFDGFSRH